jgi:PAS domain S-box-containing protein
VEPDEEVQAIIGHINTQLGIALHRIRTEKALRESERRFRAIFNQTFQFIGLMQPDGTLIEVNETALQFAGLTAADVIGKPFWETFWWTISPETQSQLKQAVTRAAAGEFIRYEVDILGQDGQTAAIDFSIKPIKNQRGEVTLLIPEGRDISQQKEAMSRLQRSQLQLAEAQRIAHIGHWEWDIRANKITWSDELYRIFGLKQDDFAASYEAFLNLIHPDDRTYAEGKITSAYENGRSFSYLHRIIRPDGLVRTIHARGRPIQDSQGSIIKLYGTAQDMTEQRATELKLAQTVRQLSALNEMGQVLASSLELSIIYEQVLSAIRPLLRAEAVILFLHEDNELVVTALDHTGIGDMLGQHIPSDYGVAGAVWESGQSLHLNGEDCLQQLSPTLIETTGYRPQSMLAVPVRWREQRLGVLEATHAQPDGFEEEDLSLLETAAIWTAIAIGNAQQYDQLQRRLRESQAIARISQALAAESPDSEQILQLIVNLARQIVPNVDWAAIHLLRGEPERLHLAASAGLEWELGEYILNPGEGVAGDAITTGRVINVTDLQNDPRRLSIEPSTNVRSLLVAPVQGRLRGIGTISLQCAVPNTFTPEDEQLLAILGVQAGMVIENARLLENQRRARQLAERQRERMRRLGQQVITAQEDERQRISRELHDEAGQSLTSLKISLDLIRAMLPDGLASIKQDMGEISELADQTMSNLRLLAHNLRPPGLDAFGLDAALGGLCQDFALHTQLKVEYKGTDIPDLPPRSALSLYRFAQEALTNVAKHAGARRVEMTLLADAEKIRLSVADDGRGFALSSELEEPVKMAGIGLTGMYERLETMGGSLEVQSAPGQGTTLIASVPIVEELAAV